jgi:hypothetical protein
LTAEVHRKIKLITAEPEAVARWGAIVEGLISGQR